MVSVSNTVLFKQCMDALKTAEVQHEIKTLFSPIVELMWEHLHPYIYVGLMLVCLINVVLLVNLVLLLLMFVSRKK